MKNRLLIALILLIFLSTYNYQKTFNFDTKFKIKKINLENNFYVSNEKINKKLAFIYEKNFFFLNNDSIKLKLKEIDFIESFEVKKIFPNTIKIKIFEHKPIAIIQKKKIKKYFTSNGTLIDYVAIKEFSNLPLVFDNHEKFKIFYRDLKKLDFPLNEIKNLYFFETNRWDILTRKDQTIKLPVKNYTKSLKNFLQIKDQANFDKYKTFDYRIIDQLILK